MFVNLELQKTCRLKAQNRTEERKWDKGMITREIELVRPNRLLSSAGLSSEDCYAKVDCLYDSVELKARPKIFAMTFSSKSGACGS